MNELSKRIFWSSLTSIGLMLVFGILLFIFPGTVIKSATIILGILFLSIGIIPIINYFMYRAKGIITTFSFMMGVFSIIVGLILLMNENILGTIIPIITGVWMIINSINRISLSMDLRDAKINKWFISFIYAIIVLVTGVLLILDPINGGRMVTKTIGIIIIVYSLIDVIDLFIIRKKLKDINIAIKHEVSKIIEESND